jgi:hypothetical protein
MDRDSWTAAAAPTELKLGWESVGPPIMDPWNASLTANASFVRATTLDDLTAILTALVLGILILSTIVGEFSPGPCLPGFA